MSNVVLVFEPTQPRAVPVYPGVSEMVNEVTGVDVSLRPALNTHRHVKMCDDYDIKAAVELRQGVAFIVGQESVVASGVVLARRT